MISDEDVRNVFTAYVIRALQRCKFKYLYRKNEYEKRNISLSDSEWDKFTNGLDYVPFSFEEINENNIVDSIENDNLLIAILKLNEKERKILNLHAVYKMKHSEIADFLGLTKSSVEKTYQRVLAKIKKCMRGDENEEF